MNEPTDLTDLLRNMEEDPAARAIVYDRLYDELHDAARHCTSNGSSGLTLQPTELLNEAYLRLMGPGQRTAWDSRDHFLRVATTCMKHILVDHARAKETQKRGSGRVQNGLDDILETYETSLAQQLPVGCRAEGRSDFVRVCEALDDLAKKDPGLARISEMSFFGGMTLEEIGRAMGGRSGSSIHHSLVTAKACLVVLLGGSQP